MKKLFKKKPLNLKSIGKTLILVPICIFVLCYTVAFSYASAGLIGVTILMFAINRSSLFNVLICIAMCMLPIFFNVQHDLGFLNWGYFIYWIQLPLFCIGSVAIGKNLGAFEIGKQLDEFAEKNKELRKENIALKGKLAEFGITEISN